MASDQACPNVTEGSPAPNLSPSSSAETQSADIPSPQSNGTMCAVEGCYGALEDWYGKVSQGAR